MLFRRINYSIISFKKYKNNFDRIKAIETAIDFYKQESMELNSFVIYYLLRVYIYLMID